MLICMNTRAGKIRVHLVHGTWANGSGKSRAAWFERGSDTYKRLQEHLPANAAIESFAWSGRNTIAARAEAAESFCRYLENSAAQHPECDHVVIAHSHGGTVAEEALSKISAKSSQPVRIRGLICLATPFVYLVKPSQTQFETGLLGLAALLNALLWSALFALYPSIPTMFPPIGLGIAAGVTVLLPLSFAAVFAHLHHRRLPSPVLREKPPDIPIFLLRATRDEATLALGVMQAFRWLSSAFAELIDVPYKGPIRKPIFWIGYGAVYSCCLAGGILAARIVESQLAMTWPGELLGAIGLFVFAPAVAGAVYFAGYALLAMAVGHTRISAWPTTAVEVDAAPPEVFCQLKVYTKLTNPPENLRHSLYEHEDVVRDVGMIVSRLFSNT